MQQTVLILCKKSSATFKKKIKKKARTNGHKKQFHRQGSF